MKRVWEGNKLQMRKRAKFYKRKTISIKIRERSIYNAYDLINIRNKYNYFQNQ